MAKIAAVTCLDDQQVCLNLVEQYSLSLSYVYSVTLEAVLFEKEGFRQINAYQGNKSFRFQGTTLAVLCPCHLTTLKNIYKHISFLNLLVYFI